MIKFFMRLKAVPVIVLIVAVLTMLFSIFENSCLSLTDNGRLYTLVGSTTEEPEPSTEYIEVKVVPQGNGTLDINKASVEGFDSLPGIGTVRADEMVKQREKMNGFTTLEDIMCTVGIGEGIFEKILPYIKIN